MIANIRVQRFETFFQLIPTSVVNATNLKDVSSSPVEC